MPDAPANNLVDRYAPEYLKPYLRIARIDRPIGWWLLLLPCWWSTALSADASGQPYPKPTFLFLFLIGAIAMRGAGSTYNDIIDRDLDRLVERTRSRPVASGQMSVRAAIIFVLFQALIGLIVLFSFNQFAILLGFASLIPVAAYPFMKRITSWPQAVLGLAFSWGALMGWAVNFGGLSAPAFWLYASAIAWTMGYDTIYAIQDLEDDAIAGIRSTARLFGNRTQLAVGSFYAISSLCGLMALIDAQVGIIAYLGLAIFALHLGQQCRKIDLQDGGLALRLFRSNRNAGLILFAGLSLDAAARALF